MSRLDQKDSVGDLRRRQSVCQYEPDPSSQMDLMSVMWFSFDVLFNLTFIQSSFSEGLTHYIYYSTLIFAIILHVLITILYALIVIIIAAVVIIVIIISYVKSIYVCFFYFFSLIYLFIYLYHPFLIR